jgi:hypothetical protein
MATILDLYKDATKNKAENELYGKDSLRIESRGLVNIPRQSALLASSPNSVADLIGGQVAGLLGGNATRPSDTIFKDDKPFRKPVTIAGGLAIIDGKVKDAIEPNTPYFVKQSPSPASFIQKVNQGTSNPLMTVANIAVDALKNPLATKNSIQNIARGLKKATEGEKYYGTGLSVDKDGNKLSKTIKFSESYPLYFKIGGDWKFNNTEKRTGNYNWDTVNEKILNNTIKEEEYTDTNNITKVIITQYGNSSAKIILPATITGLSEDFSPDWVNFKYVGSPFSNYRYTGVERSIKFNLKLYYTDDKTKKAMISNLDELRKLVYPYEEISAISYGDRNDALTFSPNLVNFTISGLYTNLFGFVEELSFNIDDNTSWATTYYEEEYSNDGEVYLGIDQQKTTFDKNKTAPYPTVIDVSLGFKVIPNFDITKVDGYSKINPKTMQRERVLSDRYFFNYDFNNGS